MTSKLVRVTSKGQLTLPAALRRRLDIRTGDYLVVALEDEEIRMKKHKPIEPLSPKDPIWQLIGVGESDATDVSEQHDRYLADAEVERWNKS